MGISSSQSLIMPTKPKTANYYGSTQTQNTWYTVLNVTNSTGIFNRIAFVTNGQSNIYLEIKITIDGLANTLTSTTSLQYSRAFVHDNTSGSPGSYNSPFGYYYDAQSYFTNSLLVEIRHTGTSSWIFDAICDYSIV